MAESYATRAEATAAAQPQCDADGAKRIVIEYLRTDGGDGRFYIEPWRVQDALFYGVAIGGKPSNTSVVTPTPPEIERSVDPRSPCAMCGGRGHTCPACGGTGFTPDE